MSLLRLRRSFFSRRLCLRLPEASGGGAREPIEVRVAREVKGGGTEPELGEEASASALAAAALLCSSWSLSTCCNCCCSCATFLASSFLRRLRFSRLLRRSSLQLDEADWEPEPEPELEEEHDDEPESESEEDEVEDADDSESESETERRRPPIFDVCEVCPKICSKQEAVAARFEFGRSEKTNIEA